jgi:hypothetical protein
MCGFGAFLQDEPIVDLRTARRALDTLSEIHAFVVDTGSSADPT